MIIILTLLFVFTFGCTPPCVYAQTAATANATLEKPEHNYTFVWFLSSGPPVVTLKGINYRVTASGPANSNFEVDWNMWLKLDGVSKVPNDTSNGFKAQTFNAAGEWFKVGWGTGTAQWSDTFPVTYERYRAEAAAIIKVGTVTRSTFDRHDFTVVMAGI
jgi:hypothetical protein